MDHRCTPDLVRYIYGALCRYGRANECKMPGQNPRVMQLVIGPVIGVVSGLILGLFSLIASGTIKTVVA